MPHELLELEQTPGVGLELLDRGRRAERMHVRFHPSPLRDVLHQVVDGSVVLLALPTLLTGHRYDVVVGLAADDPALDRLRDERRELVRHGHAHAP
jgi:hypothetical protein